MVVTPPRLDGPSGDRSASGADVGAAPRGFALIPAGWIAMGSADGQADERPVHHVWVDAFEMAIAPVTREAYAEFLSATEHPHPREWGGARTLPTGPT
ncbi:MAG: SUMF1/EgtB/PvdO family nonheme iron enzyme, partial [Vicinamibacterales bacterium]|nr:SUMF1/EgtB/PvdO family nonheme iron enzyme [Vicinamibacterales bacterium]